MHKVSWCNILLRPVFYNILYMYVRLPGYKYMIWRGGRIFKSQWYIQNGEGHFTNPNVHRDIM